ncbi:MAG: aminotransferase class IV [Mangrovibacterium sp.]
MNGKFVLYNGNFYNAGDRLFAAAQMRCILFRDALRMNQTRLMFWESHLRLLLLHFELFHLPLPYFLKNEAQELYRQIDRCLVKNKCYRSAIIHLAFFNEDVRVGYLIEIEPAEGFQYQVNPEGISLASYKHLYKGESPLSFLATGSEAIWQMAASAVGKDEIPLILSAHNNLLEVPHANLFLIHNNIVRTPNPATGAYVSPAKWLIEKLVPAAGLSYTEEDNLCEEQLHYADEAFIADDLCGIQYVRAFGPKRYFKKKVLELADLFNKALIQ